MDEDLHNIEDLFYKALDDNEEKPPHDSWDGVEKRLDKDNFISIHKKYTGLKRIAILLLLLLGISLYEMNRMQNSNTKNIKAEAAIQQTKGSIDKALNKNKNVPVQSFEPRRSKSNSVYEDERSPANIQQKGNTAQIINSEKNTYEEKTSLKFAIKDTLTSEPFTKIKFNNAGRADDKNLPLRFGDERVYNQIPSYETLENIIIENRISHLISINKKHSLPSLIFTNKTFDSNTQNVAHDTKKKPEKFSRFSITPFFSPDIAWYRLQDDNINNQSGSASDLEGEENHEFSSTYGGLIDYTFNKHWGIQSGITLSNTNITSEPEIIYARHNNKGGIEYQVNTSSGYGFILPSYSSNPALGDSLNVLTSTHLLRYAGIPMAVTYKVGKKKFRFLATTGISINFLTKARIETSVKKGIDNSTEAANDIQGLRKLYFSGLVGVGIDYRLNKKMTLAFAPTFRFAFNSINKNASVKSYPMTFGSAIGLQLGL